MTQRTQKPRLRDSLSPIARIARPEAGRYGLALAAMVAATAAAYVGPLVPQIAIDGVFARGDHEASWLVQRSVSWLGGAAHLLEQPWIFALLALGVATISGLFAYLRARLTATAAEATVERLRNTLFDRLVRAKVPALGEHETGDLVQRCTADVSTVHTFLSSQLVEVGRAAFMFLVPLPFMVLMDPWMALAAVSLIPALIVLSMRFLGKIRDSFKLMDEADAKMTSTIQENLSGSRVVRAFGQQASEEEKLADRNAAHRDLDLEVYGHAAVFWGGSDFLCVAQLSLVFAIGLGRIQSGQLTPGELFFFMSAVGMYIFPLRMMGRILSEFGKTTVAAERLGVVLDMPAEQAGSRTLAPAQQLGAAITAKGLRFRYGEALPWVLDGIDFELQPGEVLGLLGPSGAGKSTLVDLLLGLYPVEEGELVMDGVSLRDVELDALRAAIAVVPQQPILFSRSIRDNIAMGNPEATDEQIEAAAKAACIHDSILGFPEGYETVVGERGVTLSGGQRQRVAIARALVSDARLLVLDDSLSAVDTQTERSILDALKARYQKTTIVIAHRLSAIMHADLVLALDDGQIVERGNHESLVRAGGHYAQTWRQQTGQPHLVLTSQTVDSEKAS